MSTQTEIIEDLETTTKVQLPGQYMVIMHNDDKTTFDFVIFILSSVFNKTQEEAADIAADIHEKGKGVAGGPYSREVAEEKIEDTVQTARHYGFPLQVTLEDF